MVNKVVSSHVFNPLNSVITLTNICDKCTLFFLTDRETQQDIFNAMGSMYAAVLFIGITNASSVQPVVYVERSVSYRERAAGMYSALPFAFAQVNMLFRDTSITQSS